MDKSLVILLHGVGSRGRDLLPLAELWRGHLPGTAFVAPDAPHPFEQGGAGRQWFSVLGITPANRAARIAEARAGFDAALADAIEAHGLTNRLDRVALVGFSQGSIMALDALATGRWPVAAVVAFAGRLATAEPLTPAPGTRLLLVHGSSDPVMPVAEAASARSTLEASGVAVESHILPGVGHTITAEGARLAGLFLARTLVDAKKETSDGRPSGTASPE